MGEIIHVLSSQNVLASYDSDEPGTLLNGLPIIRVVGPPSESLVALALRPSTFEVYALGSINSLYTINLATGRADHTRSLVFQRDGTNFGFDFDPVADLIRIVSSADQNLLTDPDSPTLPNVEGSLGYAIGDSGFGVNPSVVDIAYSPGSAINPTTLYGIDSRRDVLVIQSPPGSGVLTTVGALGVDVAEVGGFAISPQTGTAYAALLPSAGVNSHLYKIDLKLGIATDLGELGGGVIITAMTVVPEPCTATMLTIIAFTVVAVSKRRNLHGRVRQRVFDVDHSR